MVALENEYYQLDDFYDADDANKEYQFVVAKFVRVCYGDLILQLARVFDLFIASK